LESNGDFEKVSFLLATTDPRSWIFQPASVRASTSSEAQSKAKLTTELPYKSAIRDEASETGAVQRHFTWSPTALFRFSALTYNGHMIHYSDSWCQEVEGFPGPVVHGPLNLISMLDFWRDVHGNGGGDQQPPTSIRYRALAPLYAGSPYMIEAGTPNAQDGDVEVLVKSGDGTVNMKGVIVA
jgi:hydroxyacyl-ACP dehydratase HTD2-like protein with hotdog domain